MGLSKKQLAESIADNYELSKTVATRIVDHMFAEISATLGYGTDVEINGFGKFVVTERAARTGRNPITGKAIEVPAKLAIKFKPSKTLKDNLNSEDVE